MIWMEFTKRGCGKGWILLLTSTTIDMSTRIFWMVWKAHQIRCKIPRKFKGPVTLIVLYCSWNTICQIKKGSQFILLIYFMENTFAATS